MPACAGMTGDVPLPRPYVTPAPYSSRECGCLSQQPLMVDARLRGHDRGCATPAFSRHSRAPTSHPRPTRHTRECGCLSQQPLMVDARLRGHDGGCATPAPLRHTRALLVTRMRVSQSTASDGRCPPARA